jgi:hypothetical protein
VTVSIGDLLQTALPLNRKERFYTATILPALVCSQSFAHFHLLADALNVDVDVRIHADDCTVLFFTEYSLIESLVGNAAALCPELATLPKDTPDVVVLVTEPHPVLIAIEAKMFDRPSKNDLLRQLAAQQLQLTKIVPILANHLGSTDVQLVHAALLPKQLADRVGDLGVPCLTWEWLRDTYSDVDQPYFHGLLSYALDHYTELLSPFGFNDNEVAGAALVAQALAGDGAWPYMGVRGGLHGSRLKDLVETTNGRPRSFRSGTCRCLARPTGSRLPISSSC